MASVTPCVSIGFPVYNGARLMREALDSLLRQTFGDFELIISDNASQDATEEICREYATRDPRVRYVRQPQNRGSTWNFNHVFHLSRGKYFKWAAYDDLCHPVFLQRCVEIFESRPDVLWCHVRSQHIGPDGALLHGDATPEITYAPPGERCSRISARPSERFEGVIFGREGCIDSYGLIRAAALRQTPLLLPYFGSEKILMAELALRGPYAEAPETLFFARIHPQAAGSLQSGQEQRRFINPLAKRHWQFARLHLLAGYLDAARRVELPLAERLRCGRVIAQYVLQVKKWKGILARTLTGGAIVGAYPSTDSQAKPQSPAPANSRIE